MFAYPFHNLFGAISQFSTFRFLLSFVKLYNIPLYRLWRPSPLLGGDLGVGRFVNAVVTPQEK
jgi:hypothetical protein